MVDAPAFSIQYVRHIAAQLEAMGVSVETWLGLSGLTPRALEEGTLDLSLAVLRQLILDAMRVSREPALGLFVGRRLVVWTHGSVGYAAMSSSTLGEVLTVFERFIGLRTSLLTLTHQQVGADVRVEVRETLPLGDVRRPVLEAAVLSIKNVLDDMSRGACRVEEIAFPFPAPDYAALAEDLLGCRVTYGQSWAGITVPAVYQDFRFRVSQPESFQEAALICERRLAALEASESYGTRVKRLLLDRQNGFPSLQATARLLHITPRTLHRRLVAEGTSYRELLENVRHALAVDHLRSGKVGIEEVAYMLGYSDPANFRRAFRRWEGVSPSAFRS